MYYTRIILNCIKYLTDIPDEIDLLAPNVLKPILKLKKDTLVSPTLNLNDVLIALSICSVTNPTIKKALDKLKKLNNCDAFSTYIINKADYDCMRNLIINLICEPKFDYEIEKK